MYDDRQPPPPRFKANARFASETPLDPANHARELDEVVAREKALDTDQRHVGSGGDWHLGASDKAWIKSRTD